MSESGSASVETIAALLEKAESADLRALVVREDDGWQLAHATVIMIGERVVDWIAAG